jgi:methionyl aminopeptidase
MIIIKSANEIALMRQANAIVAEVLMRMEQLARPGVALSELDAEAEAIARKRGSRPAFLGYRGFPSSICASVNEVIVHGIPNGRRLQDGDILSVDFGVEYKGYFGDSALTIAVGEVPDEARQLMRVTEECLYRAIDVVKPGARLSDIGHAVQSHAESFGYGVIRDFVGHGIGRNLHEDPQIPNVGEPGRGRRLKSGMVIAIEPMIALGTYEVEILSDGWTAVTKDRRLSAHYEHSVAVTDDGVEILSVRN